MISARISSDDDAIKIRFDAQAWFDLASEQEVRDLINCGCGGDYAADTVAKHFEDTTAKRLFDYLSAYPSMPFSDDPVGFECYLDAADIKEWIKDCPFPRLKQDQSILDRLDEIMSN